MGIKHQTKCYRNIRINKLLTVCMWNYCDLIMGDEANNKVIEEAKAKHQYIRKIKHKDGYYQLFVS